MRFASLISGKGTTAAKLFKESEGGKLHPDMHFGCVIASNRSALKSVQQLGVTGNVILLDSERYGKGEKRNHVAFGDDLIRILRGKYIDVVLQNGWMEYTPPSVIEEFNGRIFNQHPGPPEDFGNLKGRQVHAAILFYRRKMMKKGFGSDMWTEVTVQRVHENFDEGDVIHAQRVTIEKDDTPETLADRALPVEHSLQIDLLHDIAIGNVHAEQRHSIIRTDSQREILREARSAARLIYPNG